MSQTPSPIQARLSTGTNAWWWCLASRSGYQVNLVSRVPQNEGILAQSNSVKGVNNPSGSGSESQSRSESGPEEPSPTGKNDSGSNSDPEPGPGSPPPNTAESNLPPAPNFTLQWASGEGANTQIGGPGSETQNLPPPPSTPTGSGSAPFPNPTETGTGTETGTNTNSQSEEAPASGSDPSPSSLTRSSFIIPQTSPPTSSLSAIGEYRPVPSRPVPCHTV